LQRFVGAERSPFVTVLNTIENKRRLHDTIFNKKLKTFYAFWPFIYMTTVFWKPENKLLKTSFKVQVFENDTIIVSV